MRTDKDRLDEYCSIGESYCPRELWIDSDSDLRCHAKESNEFNGFARKEQGSCQVMRN